MITTRTRARLAAGAAVVGLGTLLVAVPAGAHVEPSPAAVEAGTTATISFGVEHGCEESPTTKVEVQVPDVVTDVTVAEGAPDGWTGTVDGVLVTFEGPAQPADEGFEVALTGTFPREGDALPFPLIQTCEDGSIDWIEPVVAGEDEPEHPAPTVTLTAGAPTGEQAEGGHDEAAEGGGHDEGGHDEEAATPDEGATPAEGDGASVDAAEGADAGDDDGGGSSNTGLVVGGAIAAVVVLGGIAALVLRRKDPSGPSGDGQ